MADKITWSNEKRKLSELVPWERNPRQITDKQAKRLEEYYKLLIDSGVLNTPAYALNFQTGEIKRRAESDHIGVDN